ncbi:E3 ubiquitin-protein ligase RNF115 isoform X1 [Oncorhynchus tshawytscha]|uniref:RING-type E3 ubiquitin transferase n=1 Tax=Oncorhynchus tshawytscha TaxID=74940 RepID=A0A8C8GD30_ONCTS|nr:E3 ubiquitin-protein ligase RNF115 isoform X1 [Oncorhynchus tshawytscha]XP_042169034.1 E3 ubiquitin-protein ligase RNF115 isoform X1 [Oncorhynchus tshawytscha]
MAEAAAAQQHRFFCHCCKGEIDPKFPEFTCPRCESDFIEELSEDSSLLENSSTAEANDNAGTLFSELWQLLFMERSALLSDPSAYESDPSHLQAAPASDAVEDELEGPSVGTEPLEPEPERPSRPPSQGRRQSRAPAVESIVQQFLAGLFANNGNPGVAPAALSGMFHSNPGDYAWGQGGLDAVITELLGQFESTGPPPAEKEMISSLPTVNISQEQTGGFQPSRNTKPTASMGEEDTRLECPVCREEYTVGESVKQLPCLHYFHSDCIVPWLKLHDTCPVCRKSLDGVDQSIQPPPEPPEPPSIRTDPQGERRAI